MAEGLLKLGNNCRVLDLLGWLLSSGDFLAAAIAVAGSNDSMGPIGASVAVLAYTPDRNAGAGAVASQSACPWDVLAGYGVCGIGDSAAAEQSRVV